MMYNTLYQYIIFYYSVYFIIVLTPYDYNWICCCCCCLSGLRLGVAFYCYPLGQSAKGATKAKVAGTKLFSIL